MKDKRKAKGIESTHWKIGEAGNFQAMDPQEADYADQIFPKATKPKS